MQMNLKLLKLAFLVFSLVNLTGSICLARSFGLGLLLFGPTSVSVEKYMDSNHSIDGAFGWDFSKSSEIYLHSTYLFHKPKQFHIEDYFFSLFYGAGAYIHNKKNESDLGCRFAVGSAYNVKTIPIDVFTEISANLNLVPNTEVLVNIGLGGRFFF